LKWRHEDTSPVWISSRS